MKYTLSNYFAAENAGRAASELSEELLFILPVINIVSSPNKFAKQVAVAVISSLEKISMNSLVLSDRGQAPQRKLLSISTPGCIVYRLLQHLWFQVTSIILPLKLNASLKFIRTQQREK